LGLLDKFKKTKSPKFSDEEIFLKAKKLIDEFAYIIETKNAPVINENILPSSKQAIKTALKLLIAYASEIKDEEYKNILINLFFALPQFQKLTIEEEKHLKSYCSLMTKLATGNYSNEQIKEIIKQHSGQYQVDIIEGMTLLAAFQPFLEKERNALNEELTEILNSNYNNLLKK